MLRVIQNRISANAEELLAEEQAGFSCLILIKKHLQHQWNIYASTLKRPLSECGARGFLAFVCTL